MIRNRTARGFGAPVAMVLAALFVAVPPASAHHSFAMFDMTKTVPLDAIVKELQWTNPHVWLQVVVKDPATGRDQEWGLEMQAIAIQARRGWTRNTLKPGDHVQLRINPLRNGAMGGALFSASKDGKVLGTDAPPTPVP